MGGLDDRAEIVRNALNDAGYERAGDITDAEAIAVFEAVIGVALNAALDDDEPQERRA